ncbi:MAG: type III pantothenate kinase [Christensenella sp.]|nr:type III pantothenate kinase [Christensenella sp.]
MLLVIDVGNTNIKLGVYNKDKLLESWRLSVKVARTADELGITINSLFSTKGLAFKDIDGIILSSVQPSLNYTVEHACEYYMKIKPIMVGPGIKTGINIKYLNPQEVGADRIVNSVAAYKLYGGPCIVVDFGTATTFNLISAKGEFVGGCIAPGIKTSLESLVENTSKLTNVELVKPKSVIGKTTVTNLQAGIVYGFAGLVKYLIEKLKADGMCQDAKVVFTGGLSTLITDVDKSLEVYKIDRYLTLKGLKIIYDINNE